MQINQSMIKKIIPSSVSYYLIPRRLISPFLVLRWTLENCQTFTRESCKPLLPCKRWQHGIAMCSSGSKALPGRIHNQWQKLSGNKRGTSLPSQDGHLKVASHLLQDPRVNVNETSRCADQEFAMQTLPVASTTKPLYIP